MKWSFLVSLAAVAPWSEDCLGQCQNTEKFPLANISASAFSDTTVVTTEQHAGQYFVIEHLALGATYIFSSSNSGDYLTIRDDNDPTILLAEGSPPVSLPIPAAGPDRVAVHVNLLSPPCGSDTLDRTTLVVCTSCPPLPPAIGIGVADPKATLDVAGEIRLGNGAVPPQAGAIRWNAANSDFEGYDGTKWKSLTRSNATWGSIPSAFANETIKATSNDGAANDFFGESVSISGDYAIVGASGDDIGANFDQGSAYVFKRSGTAWTQEAKLTASDGAAFDRFGSSVYISGDYAVVGARSDDVGANADQGSAYVFKRSGTTWTQEAKLTASDGAASDEFGGSVSISGNYAIVGANNDDVGTNIDQGSAYVFKRSGTAWTQEAKLTASDGAASDLFGWSVSISGDYAIVGALNDDVGANANQGSAYMFKRSGTAWAEEPKLTASDGAAGDLFGRSVSISGDYAIVGADFDDVGAITDQGSAYVFKRSGTTWTQEAKLLASDGAATDLFGWSVSISSEYAIIGAIYDDIGANANQGSAYVFKRSGTAWTQEAKLTASDGAANDTFGVSVSISDNYAVVGADFDDQGSNGNQGSVAFFPKND